MKNEETLFRSPKLRFGIKALLLLSAQIIISSERASSSLEPAKPWYMQQFDPANPNKKFRPRDGGGFATALYFAARAKDIDSVSCLLDCPGINIDAEKECHPLRIAIFMNSEEIVKLFLERGANIYARDSGRLSLNRTLLHNDFNSMAMYKIFLRHILLHHRAIGFDVQDKLGNTPLHNMILCEKWDKAYALIQCGARTDIKNNKGNTAFEARRGVRGNKNYSRDLAFFMKKLVEDDLNV